MTRDMDLIREILLLAQSRPAGEALRDFTSIKASEEEVVEYVQLLMDAKLVEAHVNRYQGGGSAIIIRLTFSGHDFIDQAANENLWSRVKKLAAKAGIPLTVEIAKELLPIAIRETISATFT